jgi:hypothetical protein
MEQLLEHVLGPVVGTVQKCLQFNPKFWLSRRVPPATARGNPSEFAAGEFAAHDPRALTGLDVFKGFSI